MMQQRQLNSKHVNVMCLTRPGMLLEILQACWGWRLNILRHRGVFKHDWATAPANLPQHKLAGIVKTMVYLNYQVNTLYKIPFCLA